MDMPSFAHVRRATGLGHRLIERAIKEGWPDLGLPPLPEASVQFLDPERVHAEMAKLSGMRERVLDNLLRPIEGEEPGYNLNIREAREEAVRRAGEQSMAAREALSMATRTAKVVNTLAKRVQELMEGGKLELPDVATPQLIALLARTADIAASTVHKAIQIERLKSGEPEAIVGVQIGTALSTATPEELQEVIKTGLLPGRLMGLVDTGERDKDEGVIDVEAKSDGDVNTLG
jgi:hypothetical protein